MLVSHSGVGLLRKMLEICSHRHLMVINLISPSGRFTSVALIERFIGSDVRMEVSDQAGEVGREMPSHG